MLYVGRCGTWNCCWSLDREDAVPRRAASKARAPPPTRRCRRDPFDEFPPTLCCCWIGSMEKKRNSLALLEIPLF
jgi:hypothetical protein